MTESASSRSADFTTWVAHNIPDGAFLQELLPWLLAKQQLDGSWDGEANDWEVVKTAVILKSLAQAGYTVGSRWRLTSDTAGECNGGVSVALAYLTHQLNSFDIDRVGEDIWDGCQALVVLAAFGRKSDGQAGADTIAVRWSEFYSAMIQPYKRNQWTGPAYLAAMIDVVQTYEPTSPALQDMFVALKACEDIRDGQPLGLFPAEERNGDKTAWNTSLVLRTLSRELPPDIPLIRRIVAVLLAEYRATDGWHTARANAPMFVARCFQGLHMAAQILPDAKTDIEGVLRDGNRRLVAARKIDKGSVKAYSAVAEYLTSQLASVPAGLLVDVASELRQPDNIEPHLMENGLQIVWLSDIHSSGQEHARLYRRIIKDFAFGLKYMHKQLLTMHFPDANLEKIVTRIKELRPTHILVTGDVTNYATLKQFQRVREAFIRIQDSVLGMNADAPGKLDRGFWTILPGNHDVVDQDQVRSLERYNLGRFFATFGDSFPDTTNDYDSLFPCERKIQGAHITARIIGLDSTVTSPVWVAGINACGRIDEGQQRRLAEMLGSASQNGMITFVALHHHPIAIPLTISDAENYFLGLDEQDARRLIALCAESHVAGILHGHFHHFSNNVYELSHGRRLHILGSPSSTFVLPSSEIQFLQLREAWRSNSAGIERGIAVYLHQMKGGCWEIKYITFIPCT